MDIALAYAVPLGEGAVQKFAARAGLLKEPPLKCFGGQVYAQPGIGGKIRFAVTEQRDRIIISTPCALAHMRSFQILALARAAVNLGEVSRLEFSREFAHLDLSAWFPGGMRKDNQIYYSRGD